MNRRIKATYEGGVLRPAEPLALKEVETAEVTVASISEADAPPDPADMAAFLAKLAAIPADGPEPDDGLSPARDHDKILYGGPKGAL